MKNLFVSPKSCSMCVIMLCFLNAFAQQTESYSKDEPCVKGVLTDYSNFEKSNSDMLKKLNPNITKPIKTVPIPGSRKTLDGDGNINILTLPIIDLGFLESLLNHLQCAFPPFAIKDNDVLPYPSPLPSSCNPLNPGNPNNIKKKTKIPSLGKSVGRLEVRFNDTDPAAIWGSGFMIAPGVFATGCHVIESLREQDPDLQLSGGESVVIDFGESPKSTDPTAEFKVLKVFDCSEERGLDVALLAVEKQNKKKDALPDPLPLYLGKLDGIRSDLSVLIGYADLDHFIDPFKAELYNSYVTSTYGKFSMIDFIITKDRCGDDNSFDIVLDIDSTTVGESGAVVIDLFDNDQNKMPIVTGIHSCCSAYFPEDKAWPPLPKRNCAQLRRTFHNQDIASWSILQDPRLCKVLNNKEHRAKAYDQNGAEKKLPCPETN